MQNCLEKERRGSWTSQLGFILAAVGSAVGLGNIWRFPYMAGTQGGALFVIIYIFCVIFFAFPIMVTEIAIGRTTRKNPVGAFKSLYPDKPWYIVGFLGIITGVAILSYYSVVAGWTIAYLVMTVTGKFQNISNPSETSEIFSSFVSNPIFTSAGLLIFLFLTMGCVIGGVQKGIEKLNKIAMPLLFIILILLVIRSVTLSGSSKGITYYFYPDISKIGANTVIAALGQALFSLSLGMGAMITYGSYLEKNSNVFRCSGWICLMDTSVALLAGLAIFPALFAMGFKPDQGPGLVFIVLPNIFGKIPLGYIFGILFFLLLMLAALTSTISLLEVVTAFIVDEWKWSRKKGVIISTALTFILGVPSALSTGAAGRLGKLYTIEGKNQGFLDMMDFLFGNISLVVGAFFISIFAGWVWKKTELFKELMEESDSTVKRKLIYTWYFFLKFICPVGIFAILVNLLRPLFK